MKEQQTPQPEQINAEQVADFLRRHPAFFVEHDELLADLIVPHEAGHAVSLVERQVKLLREPEAAALAFGSLVAFATLI